FQDNLRNEQEVVARLADMVMEIYAMDSAILRTQKAMAQNGEEKEKQKLDYTRVYVQEAFQRLELWARECLAYLEEGDTLRTMLAMVKKLTRHQPLNTLAIKQQ